MESVLLSIIFKYGVQAGQNTLYILIMGWCIMRIGSLLKNQKAMSEALLKKTDEKMCLQKHSEMARSMETLQKSNNAIVTKIDGLVNVLLQNKAD